MVLFFSAVLQIRQYAVGMEPFLEPSDLEGVGKRPEMRAQVHPPTRLRGHIIGNPLRRARDYVELLGADAARVAVAIVSLQEMRTGLLPLVGTQGGFVVADGYTHAHYLLARENGASNEWLLRRLLRILPSPDLVVFLDVSPETAKRRVEQRGIDDEELAHLERIHALWRELPEFSTFEVVGAEEPVEIVQERVRACVARAFPELRAGDGRT
jgi:Thymidylate kinase